MSGKKLFALKKWSCWNFSKDFKARIRGHTFEVKRSWSITKVFFEKKTSDDHDSAWFDQVDLISFEKWNRLVNWL